MRKKEKYYKNKINFRQKKKPKNVYMTWKQFVYVCVMLMLQV